MITFSKLTSFIGSVSFQLLVRWTEWYFVKRIHSDLDFVDIGSCKHGSLDLDLETFVWDFLLSKHSSEFWSSSNSDLLIKYYKCVIQNVCYFKFNCMGFI